MTGSGRREPVFILGLHRSGTTYLNQVLAEALPLTGLTAYHVLRFDRLLAWRREGREEEERRALEAMFRGWGMDTRRIDDVRLGPDMPEEYGWILRRRGGSFRTGARTGPVLAEVVRTLSRLGPPDQAVLLKNPWDSGRAGEILSVIPRARFIFLRRDPPAVAASQWRVARYFGRCRDRYAEELFRGIPFGRSWLRIQRGIRAAAGERLHGAVALARILRDIPRQMAGLEASWAALPEDRRLSVEYEELAGDPSAVIRRAAEFLGLDPRTAAPRTPPRRRGLPPPPEIRRVEARLLRRLRRAGLGLRPPV